jgi:hypothetical protein
MVTRIYDPNRGSGDTFVNSTGDDTAQFNSDGIATVADVSLFQKFLKVREVGVPGLYYAAAVAGNVTTTITVPAAKYWRVVGVNILLITDATATNRNVTVRLQDDSNAEIETLAHATTTESVTIGLHMLYGSDGLVVGNLGVAAVGALAVTDIASDGDTITLNLIEFTFKTVLTGAANEIILGTEAAQKTAMEDAFGATADGTNANHSVSNATRALLGMTLGDFAGDDALFTADNKGTAGNSLATTESADNLTLDAGTLGTATAGVDEALVISAEDFPEDEGPLLGPDYDIVIDEPTSGDTGDDLYIWVSYIEYDADPQLAAGIGYES